MDANERAHIEYLDYRRSKIERRTKAIEDAFRDLMSEMEKSDEIPARVQQAAEKVREAIAIDPYA